MPSELNNINLPATQKDDMLLINSSELFRTARTVGIEHAGQRYLLRLTRENKLILTK